MPTAQENGDILADLPAVLKRVHSATDLLQLSRRQRHHNGLTKSGSRGSQPCASVGNSEDRMSENSQVLYMAPNKESRRRNRSSLAAIGGNSTVLVNEMGGGKAEADDAAEELAWNVIGKEISMWQYVCETGRPYCWSMESRYSRSKELQPNLLLQPGTRVWASRMTDYSSPLSDTRRQIGSETNLIDDASDVTTLAQMVALQLLGSCFTLPPANLTSVPTSCIPNEINSAMPDPQMISSLRLHTHFRYSPCFGHEPRSPSPVQLWPGTTSDGQLSAPEEHTQLEFLSMYPNELRHGRGKSQRTLNNSENSNAGYPIHIAGGNMSHQNPLDMDPYAITKAWHRRNSLHEAVSRSLELPHLPNDGKMFDMRSRSKKRKPKMMTPQPTPNDYLTPQYVGSRELSKSRPMARSSRLQPVLRSEPHSVYVKPIKELVVKPWRRGRKKFGSSARSSQYHEGSEDVMSEAGRSGTSSPLVGEGRVRRIRAQERGDIHSSSDSVGQNNTPDGSCSEELDCRLTQPDWLYPEIHNARNRIGSDTPYSGAEESPCRNTPATTSAQRSSWLSSGNPSPGLDLTDPISNRTSEALLANNPMNTPVAKRRGTVSSPLQLPSTSATSALAATPGSPGSIMPKLGDPPTASGLKNARNSLTEFQLKNMQTAPEFSLSSMKIPDSRRRKSCLSEVCTPEEFRGPEGGRQVCERSVLSTLGSLLAIPMGETPKGLTTLSNDTFSHHSLAPIAPNGAGDADTLIVPSVKVLESPRVRRMNINGTQLFTPDPDGMEIDGLPVGPRKEMWLEPRRKREPSFL